MKAVVVNKCGGPEALDIADLPKPQPGPNQALVRIVVSGVNFIDVYYRMGLYKAEPPITLGMEGAGIVEAVGPGATDVAVGDRVAYAMARGSYAQFAVVPAWQLVKIPDKLDFESAAAAMLQGMTAHYLTHSTFPLKEGDTCLVHAAAGGVGLLLCQVAKMRGARVIGTTSTDAKAALARRSGADETILYTKTDFEQEVRRITEGRGVDVVYDSVGVATFMKSLNCLQPRGLMVSFGQSSGAVPPFDPLTLNLKGSLFLTRPSLAHYCGNRDELLWRANDILGWIAAGKVKLHIDRTYSLEDVAQAHSDLESRRSTGKLLLLP